MFEEIVIINKNRRVKEYFQVYFNPVLTTSPDFLLHFYCRAFLSGLFFFFFV
jgi:hypothetical protein